MRESMARVNPLLSTVIRDSSASTSDFIMNSTILSMRSPIFQEPFFIEIFSVKQTAVPLFACLGETFEV